MKFTITKHTFIFKRPSGTSRGILTDKSSWFLTIWDESQAQITGKGECSIIEGLSPDFIDERQYENKIRELTSALNDIELNQLSEEWILNTFHKSVPESLNYPSILFGIESALLDLLNKGRGTIFSNSFTSGTRKIPINGLVWMGNVSFMKEQIAEKIAAGFKTIKMKIGAIDFESELAVLREIRNNYSSDEITLRVDANGAFSRDKIKPVLDQLAELEIHSIEQPIQAGQLEAMKNLCEVSPIPIALDEELIGVKTEEEKIKLLEFIRPQFIILKPSLHGGLSGTIEWIKLAEERSISWWITSALESNLGLNAISQLAGNYANNLPQGLGTGSLYTNNTKTDLCVENGFIFRVTG